MFLQLEYVKGTFKPRGKPTIRVLVVVKGRLHDTAALHRLILVYEGLHHGMLVVGKTLCKSSTAVHADLRPHKLRLLHELELLRVVEVTHVRLAAVERCNVCRRQALVQFLIVSFVLDIHLSCPWRSSQCTCLPNLACNDVGIVDNSLLLNDESSWLLS